MARKKKGKKLSRLGHVKRADAAFGAYIKARDKGTCPFCKVRPVQCYFHVVSASQYATRWDPDNVVGACNGCNFRMNYNSAPFHYTYIKARGLGLWENVVERSMMPAKFSNAQLLDIEAYFKGKLAEL